MRETALLLRNFKLYAEIIEYLIRIKKQINFSESMLRQFLNKNHKNYENELKFIETEIENKKIQISDKDFIRDSGSKKNLMQKLKNIPNVFFNINFT